MKNLIKIFIIFILMLQANNIFANTFTFEELMNSSDYYLKEIVIDRENIGFYDSLGSLGLRDLNAGDIIYMKLQMNKSLANEHPITLFQFYYDLLDENRTIGVQCDPLNPLISEYIGQVNTDIAYAPFSYAKRNGVDFKHSLKIYLFASYERSLEVNVEHTKIGDNTKSLMNILSTKLNDDVINIFRGNDIIYTSDMPVLNYYFDAQEGDNMLRVSITNNTGIVKKSYDIAINKRNILGNVLNILSVGENNNQIVIINDEGRYYENNLLNKELIDKILKTNRGIYMVGDILPASKPTLERLLIP